MAMSPEQVSEVSGLPLSEVSALKAQMASTT